MGNRDLQQIVIKTVPPVKVDAVISGTSTGSYSTTLPTIIYTYPSSSNDLRVQVVDECFINHSTIVRKSIAPIYWANILNGHGFYLDYYSGYMWNYDAQVDLPIKAVSGESKCMETIDDKPFDAAKDFEKEIRLPKNLRESKNNYHFSVSWLGTKSLEVRDTRSGIDNGGALEIGRRLSNNSWLNFTLRGMSSSTECSPFPCADYVTSHSSKLISVRKFTNEGANLFGGIGFADIKIEQDNDLVYSSVDNNLNFNDRADSHYSPFFEIGWRSRNSGVFFSSRITVDFSDIGLASRSIGSDLTVQNSSELSSATRDRLNQDYRAAASVTGVEIGFGVLF